jgi:hypothetical protein
MSIPTTYCGIVYNFTTKLYNVVNQDRHGQTVGVPAISANGTPGRGEFTNTQIFPWCSGSTEIAANGWFFRSGSVTPGAGTGEFFMFQEPDDRIAFSRFVSGSPPAFPGTNADNRLHRIVNVRILPNPTGAGDEPRVDRVEA